MIYTDNDNSLAEVVDHNAQKNAALENKQLRLHAQEVKRDVAKEQKQVSATVRLWTIYWSQPNNVITAIPAKPSTSKGAHRYGALLGLLVMCSNPILNRWEVCLEDRPRSPGPAEFHSRLLRRLQHNDSAAFR
ncbi:hypothetical protein [Pseudomonas oryzihabitans]|uniref:hypothetical protein n=1 Tax=Pseudomonas oryzihabitans TaxID=47885 RepID=UPI0028946BF5|nr:hypothetical protein [Pseudomonas oryzihabitans]MDT3722458.1 hypothetical protein [Pseudomonas oryzihabitans]